LHRAVQGRGRFVEQDQRRFQHQRPGDGNALALAAGKLVGIAMAACVEADFLQQLVSLRRRTLVGAQLAMDFQAFADDLCHGHS
jgi:hypothetical protein